MVKQRSKEEGTRNKEQGRGMKKESRGRGRSHAFVRGFGRRGRRRGDVTGGWWPEAGGGKRVA